MPNLHSQINNVNEHLSTLQLGIIDNGNISNAGLSCGWLHLIIQGLGQLAINYIKKIKSFKRSWQVVDRFRSKFFNCDFSQSSEISCPKVKDSGTSDQPNSVTHNLNGLHEIRLNSPKRLLFAHININSLRNRFDMLQEVIWNRISVLLISETKVDVSFPSSQFILDGFTLPYRFRTQLGGGIMVFIREGISSKLLIPLLVKLKSY